MLDPVRTRIVATIEHLFSHGPRPLEHTLDHPGDQGLIGPGSVSWRVIGDASTMVGGIRALLVQTAHPEVVAGVGEHSAYQTDPLGRLGRTAYYVTETTYGSMPEVAAAVRHVRHAHRPVHGTSERGLAYDANDTAMAAWVHNVLTDSFLAAYQAYGATRLSPAEADRFVMEQTAVGALLDADPMPTTAAALREWIVTHPALAPSQAQADAVRFLRKPPLPLATRAGYALLYEGAVATIPPELRELIGVRPAPGGDATGAMLTGALRWALGPSPMWRLALERVGAPAPAGVTFSR